MTTFSCLVSYKGFKVKINFHSITDNASIRVAVRKQDILYLQREQRAKVCPSARCAITACDMQIFGHLQQKQSLL
jgi:hypothetical protein